MKWYHVRSKEGGACGPTLKKYTGLRERFEPCNLCKKVSDLRITPTQIQLYGLRVLQHRSPWESSSEEDDEGDEGDEVTDEDDEYISR